jgi:hypothetical protein
MDESRISSPVDHKMESVDGHSTQTRSGAGSIELRILEERSTTGLSTDAPRSFDDLGGATPIPRPQGLDPSTNPWALHDKDVGRSFTALPDVFNGNKEEYRRFRRQFGLFITANRSNFREEQSMIWFVLSYMKGGDAELWANAYVDKALENDDWGLWVDFLDVMARDFGNKTEPRKALEELGRLQQGKRTAAEYFLKFEQLADIARVDLDRYPNATLYVEKNVQRVLIDQLYQSDNPPTTYRDYKRRIVVMDEMRRRRDSHTTPRQTTVPHQKDTTAMEVDQTQKKETRKCFQCGNGGRLARNCVENKKDF